MCVDGQRPTLSLDRKDSISRPESTASTTVSTPSLHSPSSPTAAALSSLPCLPPVDAADGRGSRASSDDTGSVVSSGGLTGAHRASRLYGDLAATLANMREI